MNIKRIYQKVPLKQGGGEADVFQIDETGDLLALPTRAMRDYYSHTLAFIDPADKQTLGTALKVLWRLDSRSNNEPITLEHLNMPDSSAPAGAKPAAFYLKYTDSGEMGAGTLVLGVRYDEVGVIESDYVPLISMSMPMHGYSYLDLDRMLGVIASELDYVNYPSENVIYNRLWKRAAEALSLRSIRYTMRPPERLYTPGTPESRFLLSSTAGGRTLFGISKRMPAESIVEPENPADLRSMKRRNTDTISCGISIESFTSAVVLLLEGERDGDHRLDYALISRYYTADKTPEEAAADPSIYIPIPKVVL